MIRYSSLSAIPDIYLYLYYAAVLFSFLHFLIKYRESLFSVFIIFLFYPGLFAYFDALNGIYKIFIVVLGVILATRRKAFNELSLIRYRWMLGTFLLFTLSFLYSGYVNKDNFFMIFSQYSKYLVVLLSFFIISNEFRAKPMNIVYHQKLILRLIITQIFLAIIKLVLIGVLESVVSSLSFRGGALATVFPIIGFIFIWTIRQGKLNSRDWMLIIGLLIIGFASNKRAIWFILPFIILAFSTYVARKRFSPRIWLIVALLPLVFYLGVRLNPTLNREKEVWGSFDLDYAIDYADRYTFGRKDTDAKGQGRGGATLLLIEKITSGETTSGDMFGFGIEKYNASDYEEFENHGFGIQSKGAAAGFFQTYIASGFVGIITTILFFGSVFLSVRIKRYSLVIAGIMIWEYFLYAGITFRIQILMFLLIFCLFYRKRDELNMIKKTS